MILYQINIIMQRLKSDEDFDKNNYCHVRFSKRTIVKRNENCGGQPCTSGRRILFTYHRAMWGVTISVHLARQSQSPIHSRGWIGRVEGPKFLGKFLKNAGSRSNSGETYA